MANLQIKSWKVLWLSDDDIHRPPIVKKIKGKKKKEEIEGEQVGVENNETEDGEKIGPLWCRYKRTLLFLRRAQR
jgi:hypothetical protein